MAIEIHQFVCLDDNYGVLIHDSRTGETVSIDSPDAEIIEAELQARSWRLTHIWTTHHHADHTGGHLELKARHHCLIIGPRAEAAKIPGLDQAVGEGDSFQFGGGEVRVLDTPGHTLGHIAYWLPHAEVAFVGDTLFALGCGRVFEGTHDMMWGSLAKLAALPPPTRVYCGHEYTQSNARFARTIEPDNTDLRDRIAEIDALRSLGKPTIPTTIARELATNPFVRAGLPAVKAALGLSGADDWQVFSEIRSRKDRA
ncbi:MAG: hydroxyacylglutathione hydrolase [Hyphomicrobiaceae bacterium]|nr:hydroxyacylglutathione hydrolase [Hyphomicrobiaceae bacterium]